MAKAGLAGNIQVVRDDVTPTLTIAQQSFAPSLAVGLRAYGNELKRGVYENYKKAQQRGDNSSATKALKSSRKTLRETGKLEAALKKKSGVEVIREGKNYILRVSWEFPTSGENPQLPTYRANKDYPYIYAQEHGADMTRRAQPSHGKVKDAVTVIKRDWKLQPRPFFNSGLAEGMKRGNAAVAGTIAPYMDLNLVGSTIKYKPLGVGILPAMMPHTPLATTMYFTPPTKALAYVGAFSDFMGVWKGAFTEAAGLGYARQMIWGQSGVTKKSTRRKVRHSIWY